MQQQWTQEQAGAAQQQQYGQWGAQQQQWPAQQQQQWAPQKQSWTPEAQQALALQLIQALTQKVGLVPQLKPEEPHPAAAYYVGPTPAAQPPLPTDPSVWQQHAGQEAPPPLPTEPPDLTAPPLPTEQSSAAYDPYAQQQHFQQGAYQQMGQPQQYQAMQQQYQFQQFQQQQQQAYMAQQYGYGQQQQQGYGQGQQPGMQMPHAGGPGFISQPYPNQYGGMQPTSDGPLHGDLPPHLLPPDQFRGGPEVGPLSAAASASPGSIVSRAKQSLQPLASYTLDQEGPFRQEPSPRLAHEFDGPRTEAEAPHGAHLGAEGGMGMGGRRGSGGDVGRPPSMEAAAAVKQHLVALRAAVDAATLLRAPGRYARPARVLLVLRGLPGSGKSHLARRVSGRGSRMGVGIRAWAGWVGAHAGHGLHAYGGPAGGKSGLAGLMTREGQQGVQSGHVFG